MNFSTNERVPVPNSIIVSLSKLNKASKSIGAIDALTQRYLTHGPEDDIPRSLLCWNKRKSEMFLESQHESAR